MALSAQPYGHRDRQIADVRDRHRERTLQSDRGSSRLGAPVQGHGRLTGARASDLDLAPADAPNPEPEDLRHGLFSGPSAGEMEDVRATVHLLPLRIHAVQEAPRVLLQHVADTRGLDDVDADLGRDAQAGPATASCSTTIG